jgi:hypothetical protein
VQYAFDSDGCDPFLVPPDDIVCSQAMRTIDVAPGTERTLAITIDTNRATPGAYDVQIGDQIVRVTIV